MGRESVTLRLVYCDEYYGYTIKSWISEVKELLEREICASIKVAYEKVEERLCEHPVYLFADDRLLLEGVPGEEGYLLEILKSGLERCGQQGRSLS